MSFFSTTPAAVKLRERRISDESNSMVSAEGYHRYFLSLLNGTITIKEPEQVPANEKR